MRSDSLRLHLDCQVAFNRFRNHVLGEVSAVFRHGRSWLSLSLRGAPVLGSPPFARRAPAAAPFRAAHSGRPLKQALRPRSMLRAWVRMLLARWQWPRMVMGVAPVAVLGVQFARPSTETKGPQPIAQVSFAA